ncbi:MAG: ribosome maturation factor RimP [Alphaproteobacteria bacterium]|nr:ribosome maturation factor RimP [Alphaproteobacteria bacterium]
MARERLPIEDTVRELIEPAIEEMGFELVRVRLSGGGRSRTLQIMAERPDGTMDVDACAKLSRAVSAILDVADPIDGPYALELSSPGLDRPLTRLKDYAGHVGHEAKLELSRPREGRKRFRGIIAGVEGGEIRLSLPPGEAGPDASELCVTLAEIGDAKLVLTDALIEESLRRARQREAAQAAQAAETTEAADTAQDG